ncbi:MAG TPA: Fic/DOC family N-terminal domain-containing protein [Chitinophagaceae bacterium]
MTWLKPDLPFNDLKALPPPIDLDNPEILKKAITANRFLAELKGHCQTLPNPSLLLNTIVLQESKDSSAIENIVTTQDDLYRAILDPSDRIPANTKEVISYREAIYTGLDELKRRGVFTGNLAIKIMQRIKNTTAEFRKIQGTKLSNPSTNKIIYTPPDLDKINRKMVDWEKYINDASLETDPLILMALMHYQFEAIHPFADGNGRTGRILNVLFLISKGLLVHPILYHSQYIIKHKVNYYRRLRGVTERNEWIEWISFILDAVKETAISTLNTIREIVVLKEESLKQIKEISQKLPAHELTELIFSFPYVKIGKLVERKIAKRQAASQYLQKLAAKNVLHTFKVGREIYYVNHKLMDILTGA